MVAFASLCADTYKAGQHRVGILLLAHSHQDTIVAPNPCLDKQLYQHLRTRLLDKEGASQALALRIMLVPLLLNVCSDFAHRVRKVGDRTCVQPTQLPHALC